MLYFLSNYKYFIWSSLRNCWYCNICVYNIIWTNIQTKWWFAKRLIAVGIQVLACIMGQGSTTDLWFFLARTRWYIKWLYVRNFDQNGCKWRKMILKIDPTTWKSLWDVQFSVLDGIHLYNTSIYIKGYSSYYVCVRVCVCECVCGCALSWIDCAD